MAKNIDNVFLKMEKEKLYLAIGKFLHENWEAFSQHLFKSGWCKINESQLQEFHDHPEGFTNYEEWLKNYWELEGEAAEKPNSIDFEEVIKILDLPVYRYVLNHIDAFKSWEKTQHICKDMEEVNKIARENRYFLDEIVLYDKLLGKIID